MARRPSPRSPSTCGRSPLAVCIRPGHEHPGAAQPAARGLRRCCAPASTTGAACRPSRPITSIRKRLGRIWPTSSDARRTAGRTLVERLAISPEFLLARTADRRHDPAPRSPSATRDRMRSAAPRARTRWLATSSRRRCAFDGAGLAREVLGRRVGWRRRRRRARHVRTTPAVRAPLLIVRSRRGLRGGDRYAVRRRGPDFSAVVPAADALRARRLATPSPMSSTATSTTPTSAPTAASSAPSRRADTTSAIASPLRPRRRRDRPAHREAWQRGATEVCLQGGIRPGYTGETYLGIVAAVKAAVPDMHVHAFSPLEIWHGAGTLGLPLAAYLARLRRRASRACPARRPKSSMTRCAPSSAPTRSRPRNGSR